MKLREFIDAVEPRLASSDAAWWDEPYAPGKWTRRETIGHLIDSASNNHQRFVRAMLQDSYEGPGYDQEGCVRVQRYAAAPADVLAGLFCSYNRLLAHVMAETPAEKLATLCRVGEYPATTLGTLMSDYVAHLEHHLRQVFGAEALPYSGLPWPSVVR